MRGRFRLEPIAKVRTWLEKTPAVRKTNVQFRTCCETQPVHRAPSPGRGCFRQPKRVAGPSQWNTNGLVAQPVISLRLRNERPVPRSFLLPSEVVVRVGDPFEKLDCRMEPDDGSAMTHAPIVPE